MQGDLYRLISPRDGSEFSATQTVNLDKTQSVVFAFIHSTQEGHLFPLLKLKGLDPAANYALSSIEGKTLPGTPQSASGAWWMNHGLDFGIFVNAAWLHSFHVQYFPTQGEYGLECPVAAGFRATTGGVTLDQINLAITRVPVRAIGKLARQ